MLPIPTFLERAGEWFLRSGIQEPDGGVARYHRADLGQNARVSTEITGYAVSALVYLHHRTGDGEYLDAALRAGHFLTRDAWDSAACTFPFEYPPGADTRSLAYFFDCGIIARGLLALWRATGEAEFLEAAKCCGRSMARDFLGPGCFHPILTLPAKQPLPPDGRWSRGPGCYQLKSALAWFHLAEATGEAAWRNHFDTALEYAIEMHAAFLPGEIERERTMDRLHAYCYFLEALLAVPERAPVLGAGIDRVSGLLREIAPSFARSDVYAQLLRLRLYAGSLGISPLDAAAAGEEAREAASFQQEGGGPPVNGGFWFGRKGAELLPYSNPVSTAFCAQVLDLWEQHRAGACRPRLEDLI